MSRGAVASRAHKYARESWGGGDPERGGNLSCRHDRDGSCDHDWREDDVAVAALRVLVDSGGDVLSAFQVRWTLRDEHGMEATEGQVRRSLHLLRRHDLVRRYTVDADSDGRAVLRWRAVLLIAQRALASVAAA